MPATTSKNNLKDNYVQSRSRSTAKTGNNSAGRKTRRRTPDLHITSMHHANRRTEILLSESASDSELFYLGDSDEGSVVFDFSDAFPKEDIPLVKRENATEILKTKRQERTKSPRSRNNPRARRTRSRSPQRISRSQTDTKRPGHRVRPMSPHRKRQPVPERHIARQSFQLDIGARPNAGLESSIVINELEQRRAKRRVRQQQRKEETKQRQRKERHRIHSTAKGSLMDNKEDRWGHHSEEEDFTSSTELCESLREDSSIRRWSAWDQWEAALDANTLPVNGKKTGKDKTEVTKLCTDDASDEETQKHKKNKKKTIGKRTSVALSKLSKSLTRKK